MHQLTHDQSMLWLGMGLGKTPVTLTTIVDRMRAGQVKKTLIFGPLRVIQAVWAREARKWSHTKHLRFSVIHGTREKRSRALFADADIFLINYENMNWLAEQLMHYYIDQGKSLPFEMVVYDEISKLKNSTTLRVAGGNRDRKDGRGETYKIKVTGWRKLMTHFKYRTGLTGTPASNGYLDLHGQFLVIDDGQRLGEFITHYKDSYFVSDYNGWSYAPSELGKQWIEYKISDITVKMDARDYLDLPDCKITNLMVDLPPDARKAYFEVEKNMFTQLDSGSEVEVFSRASVSNKCLQFCNGSPYLSSESPEFEAVHDAKLNALEEVLEESGGSPVLCSYTFKSDAERIMKKFKKYKPVNLTATPSRLTESVVDKWNRGEIKLMIGHPACLHPNTQVLTKRDGWVKIIDVKSDDLVFDGVDFVKHDGCSYSGYKDVIDVFGITMTPDHKMWVNEEWVEGQYVDVSSEGQRKTEFKWKRENKGDSEMQPLRRRTNNPLPEYGPTQQEQTDSLSIMQVSSIDKHQDLENLARFKISSKKQTGRELRRSGYNFMQGVGRVLQLLQGYARRLFRRFDYRTNRCEWSLLQRKLHMGYTFRTAVEQTKQQGCDLSRRNHVPGRANQEIRLQQDDVDHETQPGDDRGRSSEKLSGFTVQEESKEKEHKTKRKAYVYDLVNCGPRTRFVVRNNKGEMFIVKNSMGHGVDGLQDTGHIIVWFGLNWSLELYEQMNGRINRQGQNHPVSLIRIMCNDTIDLAVADALERKTDDQEGLKAALQRYRDGHTTNDLEVNFY